MKLKIIALLVCILLMITSYAGIAPGNKMLADGNTLSHAGGTNSLIILKADDASTVASLLLAKGFDVLENTIQDHTVQVVVTPTELCYLQHQGFEITSITQGRPFRDIQHEQISENSTFIPPGYSDYTEIINQMNMTASTYPALCQVYDLTTTYGVSPTYEGRHLYAMKISDNVQQDEDEPTFLIVGCHHAREIVTPVIALYAITQLTTQYGNNPEITAAVDGNEIWITPVWNPDGYEYMFNYDNWWRKNRHPYPPGIGVDLNRNYPFGWDSPGGGSPDPTDETYRGPSPASEAETQTMIAFSTDQHFTKVLDYHSYGREVLYGYCALTHPFSNFLRSEAISLSTASGYGGSVRIPSADGENYEMQLAINGSYANLIETHTDFQPTYASAQTEAALLWPGILWMFQRPISLSGHIRNAITEEPLVVSIKLQEITFPNGEYFMSEPQFGRYHLFLPPGTYTLNLSLDGYYPQCQQVIITQTSAQVLEIMMQPVNAAPNTPIINGPTKGKPGVSYNYTFMSSDPDGDNVFYYIDWGDGTNTSWIGPYLSGEIVTMSHSWMNEGTYPIKTKAKDIDDTESSWSEPFRVEIIQLETTILLGLIRNLKESGEFITFNAARLLMLPSTQLIHTSGEIIISQNYTFGFVGQKVIIGVFKAAVLSETTGSYHQPS